MNTKLYSTVIFLILSTALIACGVNEQENQPSSTTPSSVSQSSRVSECGGFVAKKTALADRKPQYCDAEVLEWSFDSNTNNLVLTDKRVLLNCCGDHSVKVTKEGQTYVITEKDAPKDGTGRCRCMCVFDFEVTIKQLEQKTIAFKLRREVTDNNEPAKDIYSGTIDLTQSAGYFVVEQSDIGPWCEPVEKIPQSFKVSECGGFNSSSSADFSSDSQSNYCDAEVLEWTFDAQTGTLDLADLRVELNCCGEHDVTVTKQEQTYVITETDAPKNGNGRCNCMCVFDFSVQLEKLAVGLLPIKLIREVTDDTQPAKEVYAGTLDLTKGAGKIVVDKTPATFCGLD